VFESSLDGLRVTPLLNWKTNFYSSNNKVTIHNKSEIDPGAQLGQGVRVGPFSTIGPDVKIGDQTEIGPNVCIQRGTVVGANCRIFHGASIGGDPQIKDAHDVPSSVEIGDGTIIREFATIHRSAKENKKTIVGERCLIMAYVHLAHDCVVGNEVVIVNGTELSGHIIIENRAFISEQTDEHLLARK
jgi:UDP-N-acetylglucosamine acyltransferase